MLELVFKLHICESKVSFFRHTSTAIIAILRLIFVLTWMRTTISRGLLTWKLKMHVTFENRLYPWRCPVLVRVCSTREAHPKCSWGVQHPWGTPAVPMRVCSPRKGHFIYLPFIVMEVSSVSPRVPPPGNLGRGWFFCAKSPTLGDKLLSNFPRGRGGAMGRGSFHAKVLVLFIKNGRLPLQLIKKNTVEM